MNRHLSALTLVHMVLAMIIANVANVPSIAGAVTPTQFGMATNFPAGSNPGALVAGDFNNDGKLDLAVAHYGGVNMLFGAGGGTFSAPTNYTANSSSGVLAIGDFNNDGKLDFVASDSYGGSLLLNSGTGSFIRSNFVWNSSYYSYGAAVSDFNGDGKPDLSLATQSGPYFIVTAFGKGDGSLSNETYYNYIGVSASTDIAAGDINGDGKSDLVVSLKYYQSGVSNSVCILTNRGDGIFGVLRYYTGGIGDSHPSIRLDDFNDDGKLDMAVLNANAKTVTTRLNIGQGNFGTPSDYALGFSPTSIASGDFNGDGKIDLIIRGGSTARVMLGSGDGSFALMPPMVVPADLGFYHGTIAVGDFNGDGLPDLVFTSYNNNSVAILFNQTAPTLEITPMAGYNQIVWLANLGVGYSLEYTTNLSALVSWQLFPYPPVTLGSQKAVADWATGEQRFYRLRKP